MVLVTWAALLTACRGEHLVWPTVLLELVLLFFGELVTTQSPPHRRAPTAQMKRTIHLPPRLTFQKLRSDRVTCLLFVLFYFHELPSPKGESPDTPATSTHHKVRMAAELTTPSQVTLSLHVLFPCRNSPLPVAAWRLSAFP